MEGRPLVEWQLWLVLAMVLGVAEIITTGFFVLWFAIGAGAAALAAALGADIVVQLVVFLAISGLLVIFTRPVVHRFVEGRRPAYRTNVSALVGKVGVVVREVEPLEVTGLVKVQGEIWTAVTDGASIPEGVAVVVERVDGVKLSVSPTRDLPSG
jgi:membrane protein implicated in regulation of membrane protease activity